MKRLFFDFSEFKLEPFQFENLLSNAIGFRLIILDQIDNVLPQHKVAFLRAEVLSDEPVDLLERGWSLNEPIVFLCSRGKKSKKIIKNTADLGFKNLYFLEGGYQRLLIQKESV